MSEAAMWADDLTMNENQNPLPPPPPPSSTTARRLTRSSDNKMIGGVAGGLGRHLDVDPVIVRLAFVILALFGGSGLLLYALAWIIIPADRHDAGDQPVVVDTTTTSSPASAADPTASTPSAAVAVYTPV